MPPSAAMFAPVTNDAISEASHTTTSHWAQRCQRCCGRYPAGRRHPPQFARAPSRLPRSRPVQADNPRGHPDTHPVYAEFTVRATARCRHGAAREHQQPIQEVPPNPLRLEQPQTSNVRICRVRGPSLIGRRTFTRLLLPLCREGSAHISGRLSYGVTVRV